jgi:hypothetical protein
MEYPPRWKVRDGSERDMQPILSLRKIVFGEAEKDRLAPEFWRWEYLEGPEGRGFLYIVEKEKKVVGHLSDLPKRFLVNGEVIPGAFHLELMVHPDDWRKGIFYEMEKYSIQRMEDERKRLMTACTIRKESINGLKKAGWKAVAEFPVLVYPIRFQGILNRYLRFLPLSFFMGGSLRFFYDLFFRKRSIPKTEGVKIEEVAKWDHPFDLFWEKASSLFPIMGDRNRDFLTWRYFQHPTRHYLLYRGMKRGEMRGLIVLRKVDLLEFNSAVIVDLLALDDETWTGLVAEGIEFGKREGADLLGIMVPKEHAYYGRLRERGFLPSFKTFSFLIYSHTDKPSLFSPENWHFNWGDTDVL